jgi:hypothetical protein
MLARQRCGGGHSGRRFLGHSSKASLVRRCVALGQTASSGLCHHQPARRGAHRGCPESRDLRQRQLSADAVRAPGSRLTAIGLHAGSGPRAFVRVDRPITARISWTHQRASRAGEGHPNQDWTSTLRPRNLRPASFVISRMSKDFSSIPSSDIT